ncbi:hypothetical protein OBBRIDRAFT_836959 [Obba rivulosa]|uniref:Uncharacterized protein n=1 Tax=Obba rivulosa TaxID=1052685 RepID=A0A8E2AYT1_9APHY|nr:hypothetical protein OBBRIDRAFT_836959 [Obba rivulosa]
MTYPFPPRLLDPSTRPIQRSPVHSYSPPLLILNHTRHPRILQAPPSLRLSPTRASIRTREAASAPPPGRRLRQAVAGVPVCIVRQSAHTRSTQAACAAAAAQVPEPRAPTARGVPGVQGNLQCPARSRCARERSMQQVPRPTSGPREPGQPTSLRVPATPWRVVGLV